MVKEFKTVYSPALTVSFNSSRTLTSYIVRIELYSLVRSVGSFKYKKPPCEVSVNVTEADTFTTTVITYKPLF